MIDQTRLPFEFEIFKAKTVDDCCFAIKTMVVRGAGAIGATAGFAMALAFMKSTEKDREEFVKKAKLEIENTRPTARNLFYATNRVYKAGIKSPENALIEAQYIADENIRDAELIGKFGADLIKDNMNIATQCNAGWLGFVDYGSALSPVYTANNEGREVFIYVNETRPRGQGAKLTAWELHNENIPHAIIADNAFAWLASLGKIDLFIAGADRIAANGDVANKIGTLDKAIIANEYGIPFYIAAPLSTFDAGCASGAEIPIEERAQEEVLWQTGMTKDGKIEPVLVCNPGSGAVNPAFDVTPAKYITGIITEKGILKPDKEDILPQIKSKK